MTDRIDRALSAYEELSGNVLSERSRKQLRVVLEYHNTEDQAALFLLIERHLRTGKMT